MTKTKKTVRNRWRRCRPLVATALALGGVFNMVSLVLAEGTDAGTLINNTATATYDDGTTSFEAISNTVTIEVAEVAGLTVQEAGFIDGNTGSINTGDQLSFDFLVTNTGNANTFVFVPGQTALQDLVIENSGVDSGTITSVEIIEVDGTTLGTAAVVPATGVTTQGLTNMPSGGVISPNPGGGSTTGTFRVRVTLTVTADQVGDNVGVQFGNTADNNVAPADGTQNQQNIRDDSDGNTNANDLRTLNEGTDNPVNGQREAAASRQEPLFTAPATALAQATILKTSVYNAQGTANDASDDTITYSLNFNVLNNPLTGLAAGNLEGTTVTVDGVATANRVLVSDVIPPEAVWNGTIPTVGNFGLPNANWTVVYSTDNPAVTSNNALQVDWQTTAPTANTVRRIGFIYDSNANGAFAPTASEGSFTFTVVTSNLPAAVTNVAVSNVAQLFGESEGDPGDNLVFDESGDQRPNNADDGVDPTLTTNFNPTTDLGIGDDGDSETTSNANDGTGPDGESNVVTISTATPDPASLLNGPDNAPSAIGPTDNDDDFTNVGVTVSVVGPLGSTAGDPAATAAITNEVSNVATTQLDTVTLLPLAPSDAQTATGNNVYGTDTSIPDGTLVTIQFGTQTVQYEYTNGTGFHTPSNTGAVPNPVVLGSIAPGANVEYQVTIDLPAGTPQITGYGIPIVAFVDNNGSGDFETATEPVFNITIDRVYPGFMNLLKEVRILDSTGAVKTGADFTNTPTSPAYDVEPGEFVEYRITYTNVSEAQPVTGNGNALLNAQNFTILEDGDAGGNSWDTTTTHQQQTSSGAGTTVNYYSAYTDGTTNTLFGTTDPANGTDIEAYENAIGTVAPQGTGTFQFRRLVD